ncbi:hypothetical protein NDU88_004834 [Pleurodeles waltl]|uniref:CARD domain-containing protein n=1 Tax=Pleurodeles waltl TaxID=8319 RepID=A0AAV7W9Q9_PLEWA|nr:hypothetical protein NDU88_004834 [Pleurodeles waltl]
MGANPEPWPAVTLHSGSRTARPENEEKAAPQGRAPHNKETEESGVMEVQADCSGKEDKRSDGETEITAEKPSHASGEAWQDQSDAANRKSSWTTLTPDLAAGFPQPLPSVPRRMSNSKKKVTFNQRPIYVGAREGKVGNNRHTQILQHNYAYIVKSLPLSGLLYRRLNETGVLTTDQIGEIELEDSTERKVAKLLEILKKGDQHMFASFCDVLHEEGFQHLAQTLITEITRQVPSFSTARPDGSEVLRGDTPRPRRSKAGEGRARRRTRVLEERDETQCGAVGPERTEGEQKEEATEGGRHTEQSAFVERRPRGRVVDEEASHVPGGAFLIQVRGRAGEGGIIIRREGEGDLEGVGNTLGTNELKKRIRAQGHKVTDER